MDKYFMIENKVHILNLYKTVLNSSLIQDLWMYLLFTTPPSLTLNRLRLSDDSIKNTA